MGRVSRTCGCQASAELAPLAATKTVNQQKSHRPKQSANKTVSDQDSQQTRWPAENKTVGQLQARQSGQSASIKTVTPLETHLCYPREVVSRFTNIRTPSQRRVGAVSCKQYSQRTKQSPKKTDTEYDSHRTRQPDENKTVGQLQTGQSVSIDQNNQTTWNAFVLS